MLVSENVLAGLFLFVLLQRNSANAPDGLMIPIGAIFSDGQDDKQAISVFRAAQAKYNRISTNPFAVVSFIDTIDVHDPFTLASKMCDRMETGVFLFYGVKDMRSLDIVQSFTRTFHMPYLTPSTSRWTMSAEPSYEVHMKPDFSHAIIDMILYYEWTNIHYVYDSDEGLSHIQFVLNELQEESERRADRLTVNVVARRIYNVTHAHDELRQLDRMETDPNVVKVIVFDLYTESAYRHILRQIPEVGMNKEGYHYLVATLDFAILDMGRYLHGGVNITGFQLLDPDNSLVRKFIERNRENITYEAALADDAFEVITRALQGMVDENSKIFQMTFRRKQVFNFNKTQGIPCTTDPPMPWMHGEEIMRQIRKLDFEGLTGRIRFDDFNFRTDYKLDVYTVGLDRGPVKIGNWTFEGRFQSLHSSEQKGSYERNATGVKIITTILSNPFFMEVEGNDKTGKPFVGNKRYEGYLVDLADEIIDFEYVYRLVRDRQYGTYNETTKTWNGMVGEIVRKEADLCIAPLTILYSREVVVDFTKPFMNFGISIMIKKPEILKPGVFSFMEPLETKIWICIVLAYSFVSIGLFLVSRFSPFEWQTSSSMEMENNFNILNSLWFSMGALMLQGSDACPRSFSGRVIGTVWWFFILIIISSYTANLAAFLTIERMNTPINNVDDLAMQSEIKYGTLGSGSTKEFFMTSSNPTFNRMYEYMVANPSVFVATVGEGIERVKKSKGKYAFLLESPTNEYTNSKEPCDTMKVGANLNSKGFGVATPKGSPLRDKLNLGVLELMEGGVLLKLKNKWWKDKGVCAAKEGDSSGKRELSLSNVAGVFYILVGGLAASVVLASIEFLFKKSKFLEKTTYLKATETLTTLLATPTADKENGGLEHTHAHNSNNSRHDLDSNYGHHDHHDHHDHEKEESTYNYSAPPVCIGFEHFNSPLREGVTSSPVYGDQRFASPIREKIYHSTFKDNSEL